VYVASETNRTKNREAAMEGGARKWGVTKVIVHYVSGDDTWEIEMDPKKIDILVFNWKRFRRVNEVIGEPLKKNHHVRPDGRLVHGDEPAAEVARRMGINGPPRRIGRREEGTSLDSMCVHNENCTWWCVGDDHDHDGEDS
jgi:hypothetical protein